jgi:hypothetical protein
MALQSWPNQCPICEGILTLDANIVHNSCSDPSHWQAIGLLSAKDYYTMAQLAARAAVARSQSNGNQQHSPHP